MSAWHRLLWLAVWVGAAAGYQSRFVRQNMKLLPDTKLESHYGPYQIDGEAWKHQWAHTTDFYGAHPPKTGTLLHYPPWSGKQMAQDYYFSDKVG